MVMLAIWRVQIIVWDAKVRPRRVSLVRPKHKLKWVAYIGGKRESRRLMGEVVGMAASICKRYDILPRGVYEKHLPELKAMMDKGVGVLGFPEADKLK